MIYDFFKILSRICISSEIHGNPKEIRRNPREINENRLKPMKNPFPSYNDFRSGLFLIIVGNWLLSDLCCQTRRKIRWTELLHSNLIRQILTPVIEEFYHGIRCHSTGRNLAVSGNWMARNRVGSQQILKSNLTGSDCTNPIGTQWIRQVDINGKQWISSESDEK